MSVFSFSSNENKGLLWNLMYESGVFHDIPSEMVANVKTILDKEISSIENYSGTILEKNKKVVTGVVNKLVQLRSQGATTPSRQLVTADELSKLRQETFGKDLERRQKEYGELMGTKQPDAVDFSIQNSDKPIGEEMNKILADTMSRRARELEQVIAMKWISSESETKKWISNESPDENEIGQKRPSSKQLNNNGDVRLTIGEKLDNHKVMPVAVKRVTFSEAPKLVSNTLASLDQQHRSELYEDYSRENIVKNIRQLMSDILEKSRNVDELLSKLEIT